MAYFVLLSGKLILAVYKPLILLKRSVRNPMPKQSRPYPTESHQHPFDDENQVVSATECTGMLPTPATEDAEIFSYHAIYDIPLGEDQGEELRRLEEKSPGSSN